MKKQINIALAIVITAIVLGGSHFVASAQTAQHLAFEVPFDFIVGDRQLPAGRYRVRRVKADSETALRIEDERGRLRATVLTNSAVAAPGRAGLTFKQYGDQHFLAAVWMPGAAGGRELQESKQERKLREGLAAGRAAPKTVAVLARQK